MKRKLTTMLGLIVAFAILMSSPAHAMVQPAEVETLAGTGSHGADDGMAAQFNLPMGIGSTPYGHVLVADTFNSLIRAIDEYGAVSSLNFHFPELDAGGFPIGGHNDREFETALFNRPSGFAEGFHGWIFVADTNNHAIRVIIGDRVYTIAGGGGSGFEDALRLYARLSYPTAVAACPDGFIYIADTGNHVIRRIDQAGYVTTVAGVAGTYGYNNGSLDAALFDSPMGLAFCYGGRLFVADTGNNVIRVIEDGSVSTFAGIRLMDEDDGFGEWAEAAIGGFVDGTNQAALFNRPMGLAFSGGVLFIADSGNHRIRAIVDDAETITVAGTGYPGHADGGFGEAMFFLPSGLYVFGDVLLVADTGNNMIRSLDLIAFFDQFD